MPLLVSLNPDRWVQSTNSNAGPSVRESLPSRQWQRIRSLNPPSRLLLLPAPLSRRASLTASPDFQLPLLCASKSTFYYHCISPTTAIVVVKHGRNKAGSGLFSIHEFHYLTDCRRTSPGNSVWLRGSLLRFVWLINSCLVNPRPV